MNFELIMRAICYSHAQYLLCYLNYAWENIFTIMSYTNDVKGTYFVRNTDATSIVSPSIFLLFFMCFLEHSYITIYSLGKRASWRTDRQAYEQMNYTSKEKKNWILQFFNYLVYQFSTIKL